MSRPAEGYILGALELKLDQRRLSPETIRLFRIEPVVLRDGRAGWKYPLPFGGYQFKNANSTPQTKQEAADFKKYFWARPDGEPGKKPERTWYFSPEFQQAARDLGEAWLVSGAPDTWQAHEAGMPNALSGQGEMKLPDDFVPFLQSLQIHTLHIAPDRDDRGMMWAGMVAAALTGSGIQLQAYQLPGELGSKQDLGKAWEAYTGTAPFQEWLKALPALQIQMPEPKVQTVSSARAVDSVRTEFTDTILRELDYRDGFSRDGWGKKPLLCLFHDDHKPSARLNAAGMYCYVCKRQYLWNDLGTKLGLGTQGEWLRAHQDLLPALDHVERTVRMEHQEAGMPTAYALSYQTRRKLASLGRDAEARVLDALYLTGWRAGRVFTGAEALEALSEFHRVDGGASFSRRLLARVLAEDPEQALTKKGKAKSAGNYVQFISLFSIKRDIDGDYIGKESAQKSLGRPAAKYRVPAPAEVAQILGVDHGYTEPATVQALSSAAEYRAWIYAYLPTHRPGRYARITLCKVAGVSAPTSRKYDQRAGVKVTAQAPKLVPLTVAMLKDLPAKLPKKAQGSRWLQDAEGRKLAPATSFGAKHAIKTLGDEGKPQELWLATRQKSHYRAMTPAEAAERAQQAVAAKIRMLAPVKYRKSRYMEFPQSKPLQPMPGTRKPAAAFTEHAADTLRKRLGGGWDGVGLKSLLWILRGGRGGDVVRYQVAHAQADYMLGQMGRDVSALHAALDHIEANLKLPPVWVQRQWGVAV